MSTTTHRRALTYAAARREGDTWAEIARFFRISRQVVWWTMRNACPPFIEPEPPRPDWSKPDAITLKLVREARKEIERALAAGWHV